MTPSWARGRSCTRSIPAPSRTRTVNGIGDLPGVTASLNHLAGQTDSLGVDAIWLSPFYPHGGVDGGYDVTDFTAVAPEFGSLTDVDRLLAVCHERGVRVLLDLVTGHTSDRHPWFAPPAVARRPVPDWYLG